MELATEKTEAVENLPAGLNFEKIVNESKQKIFESEPAPPKKRGRGRPPGRYGSYKGKAGAQNQGAANGVDPVAVNGATAPGHVGTPMPDMAEHLVTPLKVVSLIPARKYRCDDLALKDDEALILAQSIDGMLKAFVPDLEAMDPKTAAVFNFGIVTSSLFISKFQIYQDQKTELIKAQELKFKEENKPENRSETEPFPVENIGNATDNGQKTSAVDYFRTKI